MMQVLGKPEHRSKSSLAENAEENPLKAEKLFLVINP